MRAKSPRTSLPAMVTESSARSCIAAIWQGVVDDPLTHAPMRHLHAQCNLTKATALQRLAGGEAEALRIYTLAQRLPPYRGYEALLVRTLAWSTPANAAQRAGGVAAAARELRQVADAHAARSAEVGTATVVSPQANPQRPAQRPGNPVTLALKMRVFSNSAGAISDPVRFKTYLGLLDGQPISTVIRIGSTGVRLDEFTLAERTLSYRAADERQLASDQPDDYAPQMPPFNLGKSHEVHTAFGAVSKVGEVNANGVSFGVNSPSASAWADRGRLPGAGGQPLAQHWAVDFTETWIRADDALTALETVGASWNADQLATKAIEPLREKGFIPEGSALAARLEPIEARFARRDELRKQLANAHGADRTALSAQLQTAEHEVTHAVADAAAVATQSRADLLTESLGTPKTTYELTVRHATAARYMQSIEGEANAVFSASKFEAILEAVEAEAGPENEVSLRWHRALVGSYLVDAQFDTAMQRSEPMRAAWAAYKQRYGI